ncbi:hypothetical protein KIN20_035315 [Parelaphostrongylus tenuis]|uniref:Uncharacterized protein n=1 Tax=Parelaphostrongylus tenuis TaxID=148309 RepID=A0AAD5WJU8_PARTN|nr:hypothetical protein KIN20_035315 [Parelaphostrongylus tenuis]
MDAIYRIVVGNTVTGICTIVRRLETNVQYARAAKTAVTAINGTHLTISGTLSVGIAFFMYNFISKKFIVDYKQHHGELAESDVAKCSGQSRANIGIGPFGSHFFSARAIVSGS